MKDSINNQNLDKANLPPETIKVMEEFASIRKEVVETGKVRITKTVNEETVGIYAPILNESYDIKHVSVPYSLSDSPPTSLIQQGDTTIIKVVREISVIVKKYEVLEEIHITRHLTETPLTHEILLRKENVQIDRIKSE